MENIFKLHNYTDSDLETLKKYLEEEIINRKVLERLNNLIDTNFPGDSLPYPKITKEELDNELYDISNEIIRKKFFNEHFC
jgi:hypothetical protein